MRESYAIYRELGNGEKTMQVYFIIDDDAATRARIRAYENALKELGGKVESENVFTLPESDFTRRIICVKKTDNLSTRYPRKAGIPKKNPL